MTLAAGCSPTSGGGECGPADRCGGEPADGSESAVDAGAAPVLGRFDQDAGGTPDALPPDAACVAVESQAERLERPADIIVMVDSTPSMGPAVQRIESVINDDFASIVSSSGVDYQVILLAQEVAIGPPLSDSGRLHTLDLGLGSGSSAAFAPVLDRYSDWSGWLRTDAFKVFLHFTDSNDSSGGSRIAGYEGTFDEELVALDPGQFGTAERPKLVYNAIVGLRPNEPVTAPYAPPSGTCGGGDPVVSEACSSADFRDPPGPGEGFQQVAMRTGGLRFSVCEFDHFDVVFRQLADQVVEVSSAPCTFRLPPPPDGETLDPATIALRLSLSGGDSWETLYRADDAGACDSSSFLIGGDEIELCPDACARVECSRDAQLRAVAGCDPSLL